MKFEPRQAIKTQALADFLTEMMMDVGLPDSTLEGYAVADQNSEE